MDALHTLLVSAGALALGSGGLAPGGFSPLDSDWAEGAASAAGAALAMGPRDISIEVPA